MLSLVVRFVVLAVCLVNVVSARRRTLCPKLQPVPNFDPKELTGQWYIILWTVSPELECYSMTFKQEDDDGDFDYYERYAWKGYYTSNYEGEWVPTGNDSTTFLLDEYDEVYHVVAMLPDYAVLVVCPSDSDHYFDWYVLAMARASKVNDIAYGSLEVFMRKLSGKQELYQVNQYDCATNRDEPDDNA